MWQAVPSYGHRVNHKTTVEPYHCRHGSAVAPFRRKDLKQKQASEKKKKYAKKGDKGGMDTWSDELGKLGFDWYKDQGHKKHGWKNVYHKEEWGDSKKYHDIAHDKDWKKKWNKLKEKKVTKTKKKKEKSKVKKKHHKGIKEKGLKKKSKGKKGHISKSHLKKKKKKGTKKKKKQHHDDEHDDHDD